MGAYRAALAAALALAACGGNPFVETTDSEVVIPTDPDTGEEIAVPLNNGVLLYDDVRGNVNGVTFANSAGGSIQLDVDAQDAAALNATYTRNAALDVGKYKAYTHQETGSNRLVVALVSDELDSAKAVLAVDGGQFANYHGGGIYTRAEAFTKPNSPAGAQAKFNYSGTYAGMLNFGPTPPGGPGGSLNPTQAYRTTGRVLVTADFEHMNLSGGIDNRRIVDTGTRLADQMMYRGDIDAAGNFNGKTQRLDIDPTSGDASLVDSGSYAGIFSGDDAAEIAALYVFSPIQGDNTSEERGIFTAANCVKAGGPACP